MLLLLAVVVAVVCKARKQQRQHEAAAAAAAEVDGMDTVGMMDNPMSTASQNARNASQSHMRAGGAVVYNQSFEAADAAANNRNSRQDNNGDLGELGPGVRGNGTSSGSVAAVRSSTAAPEYDLAAAGDSTNHYDMQAPRRRRAPNEQQPPAQLAAGPPALRLASAGSTAKLHEGGVERGDVIYNSNSPGDEPVTSSLQQQPAVVYAVPHANRNAAAGAGAAAEAQYAGYEPPGVMPSPTASGAVYVGGGAAPPTHDGAAASNIVYAVPLGGGRLVVPRVPNLMYQSADGPPNDERSLVRVPNVMHEPAANNAYDAGVNSNANSNTTTTATGNGCGGGYYDVDPVPNAGSADYATPLDDAVIMTREARNQPILVQVYGDDNGHVSDADDNGGTAA